jgi:2-deoxy-D-gluconate 3-dehydrogenase
MSILDSFRLEGKTALVTGASRGIGMGLALGLAEAGADIIGVSATMPEDPAASAVGRAVAQLGRRFAGLPCDMRNRKAIYALVDRLRRERPPVDILLCNAGTILRTPAAEHPDEMWDEVIDVNLTAPFILAREIGKIMVERGRGKIIFTASLLSYQGGITVPGYAASKGGIARLTMALANEWAGRGVNVNAIVPGYIATDNTQALRDDPVRSAQILARIPAGRWGEPDDFKGAAVYLASDAAKYVHGALLPVDGGWLGR